MVKRITQSELNTALLAAAALAHTNQLVEAEIRFKNALRAAEKKHGAASDQAMLVSSVLAAFYRSHNRISEALEIEGRLETWQMQDESVADDPSGKKFVGGSRSDQNVRSDESALRVPANLRKACQILGLSMETGITAAAVNRAWKKQMLAKSAHPDLGGNTEEAVLLNDAKEQLMSFLQERAPKLGTKFKKDKSSS